MGQRQPTGGEWYNAPAVNPSTLLVALTLAAPTVSSSALSGEHDQPLPWEFWTDARNLPRVASRGAVGLRSSYCPSGCRYDRHSSGDSRFLKVIDGEGVLLEQEGPGAITRIWMTMGMGTSVPLDPAIRIRIYLDGEAEPRIDLPLPELFRGGREPFTPPLVGDRMSSSGGNFSYVPIAYRAGCRVTLVGAQASRIWFQINYHRLESAANLKTFDGGEDLTRLRALLSSPGTDPWPETPPAAPGADTTGEVELSPGEATILFEEEASGLLTGLWLEAPESSWGELRLALDFDGSTTVDLPLRDFFAIGRSGALPTRSLLMGQDATGGLYSFFPMPYFRHVKVRLVRTRSEGARTTTIAYRVRRTRQEPASDSGLFGAQLRVADPAVPGSDIRLLELVGQGKWVGLFSELASIDTRVGLYLEGDERVYIDGSAEPTLHGTGTEDLFNGGFYFDQGPFRHALHGMTYQTTTSSSSITGAYRLFLTDAVAFDSAIRADLEAGPTGRQPMRARTVAYYYVRPRPPERLADPGSHRVLELE